MRRIQKFILSDEVDTKMIKMISKEESNIAVDISDGNFFWGIKTEDEKDLENQK